MGARILIVEDNVDVARLIHETLAAEPEGFDVSEAYSAERAFRHLAERDVDCVLLDYRLPDSDGLKCLAKIRQRHPRLPVIFVTGEGSEEVAVEAMRGGAVHYLVKHGRAYLKAVALVVREALGRVELERTADRYRSEVDRLRRELRERYRLDGIIGQSPAIEEALALAEQAARSDVTVLLEGETGTGKEVFARAIHYHGARAQGPFQAVNCAGVPDTLLESELFGHERGAFTGADRRRTGVFEEAHRGTLFLDEVSRTSPAFQTKLLRVLQNGEIRSLGTNVTRRVDVRIIAATNQDLQAAAQEGRFAEDLYYRLSAFPIRLPPLRERRGDIARLAVCFLNAFSAKEGKSLAGFHPEALQRLEQFCWPGNVRQLENEIQRLVVIAQPGARITPDLLSPCIRGTARPAIAADLRPIKDIVTDVEIAVIIERERRFGGNRCAAARSLGLTREGLWAKKRRLGILDVPGAQASGSSTDSSGGRRDESGAEALVNGRSRLRGGNGEESGIAAAPGVRP
jgi:two-component system response regulator PilR (NtrC family)/two-component system response regulator HydG